MFDNLFKSETANTPDDDPRDDRPCNEVGHNWEHKGIDAYHTDGVPHFGMGDSWKVYRKDYYKCTKCGSPDFRKTNIGKISVDKETDELTIVRNDTRSSDEEEFDSLEEAREALSTEEFIERYEV